MPYYEFVCEGNGDHVTEVFFSVSEVPMKMPCAVCGKMAIRLPFPRRVYVGKGIKSRVYHQWIGDPRKCPSDLREVLKKQDKPASADWYRHPEETYGSEQARWREDIIKRGLERRREKGVTYKIGSTLGAPSEF